MQAIAARRARAAQGQPYTLSLRTTDDDGTAANAGAVTVTVTRADGSAIATNVSVSPTTVGDYEYVLAAAAVADLDELTAVWTVTSPSITVRQTVEVAGGYVFELWQARKDVTIGKTDRDNELVFSDEDLELARLVAEDALEWACQGVAFVPRYARETLDGNGRTTLLVSHGRLLDVLAVTVDGAAVDVADISWSDTGELEYSATWSTGRRNVVVAYAHGHELPPDRVPGAAIALAKAGLLELRETRTSSRATSVTNADGVTERYLVAGIRGNVFDLPECNAVVAEHSWHSGLA